MYMLVGSPIATRSLRKRLEFFEMHICLGPGAQTMFKHKGQKLDTVLFYFVALVNLVPSVIGMNFFQPWIRF